MSKSYEGKYNDLEVIVKKLEQEETGLEESIELFKEGIKLKGECQEILNGAQNQVIEILKENGGKDEY